MNFQKIKSVKKLGVQKCMDFTVDSKDHNFYAEGIVTSNCYSYSYVTAYTVYLKSKYLKEFYLACLMMCHAEPHPLEHICLIQTEMAQNGIKLLPPDLATSSFEFDIDNSDIRYGLSSIRGVKEKIFTKLDNFRKAYNNKFEMFEAGLESGINLTVMGALIKAGCLDRYMLKSRSYLLLEYSSYKLLKDREKIILHKLGPRFNFDVLAIVKHMSENIDEDGKNYIKEKRFTTFKRDYDVFKQIFRENSKNERLTNYLYEKEVLGFSYSHKLKDIYKENSPQLSSIFDARNLDNGKNGTIVAFVKDIENKLSKKKKRYLNVLLEDETGVFKCQFHSRQNTDIILDIEEENEGALPKKGDLVFIKFSKGDGDILWGLYCKILDFTVYLKVSQYRKEMEKNIEKTNEGNQ